MLSRRILTGVIRTHRVRVYSSRQSGESDDGVERKAGDTSEKVSDVTERINKLLQSMIEDKAKSDAAPLKSIFSTENVGFKKTKPVNIKLTPAEVTANDIKKAVDAVADSLGDDVNRTKDELLSRTFAPPNPDFNANWSEMIDGMKVDNSSGPSYASSRSDQVKSVMGKAKARGEFYSRKEPKEKRQTTPSITDILNGKPLGIFKNVTNKTGIELKMWNKLRQRELDLAITHPPANYFQKMILWTNEGKLWKFPIDNEQGLEKEQEVHFSEHIFLETHLEGWCPPKGPIRHFMELVCIGLSKNPYISVQDKRDHIGWYRDYFESKKDLLTQVGAIGEGLKKKTLNA